MRRTSWSSDWYRSSSDSTREGAGNAPAVKKEMNPMSTKEDVKQSLLDQMKDPALPGDVFDELNRRMKLLDEE